MPRHPLCQEHNQFKIAGSGLDLFATSEGVEPVSFRAEFIGHDGVVVHADDAVTSPVKWLLSGIFRGPTRLTTRYSINGTAEAHCYCVTPDTGKDETYLLRIVRRET